MAKQTFSIDFSNCTISLENNEIVEHPKKKDDQPKSYVLSEILKQLEGENRRFSISIRESIDLVPNDIG